MPRKRAALVGCGFFADNHLNAWRDLRDRCEVVAVCDLDAAKARAAGARFGIPGVYTDFETLVEAAYRSAAEGVDVVPEWT